jgi:hypothetical protein
MVENLSNHVGVVDEGKDPKSPTALTEEGVGFERPSLSNLPIAF